MSTDDAPLDPSPALSALEPLVDGFRAAGLDVSMDVPDPLPELSGAADLAAYRLVQEALTNTLRHAAAARAAVRVVVRDGSVEVVVEDDGHASAVPATDGTGRGLIGMRERVRMAGGHLLEAGRTGHGFLVRARLPLQEAELQPVETAP
jgi:signal transduction histidine kinase